MYIHMHVCIASFPGRVGGEKTAWYPLLAQAPLFPVYFRKIVMFTLSFHVDHIRTEYSRSNLRTRSSQKVAESISVESVIQKGDPSIPLLSSVM